MDAASSCPILLIRVESFNLRLLIMYLADTIF
jgi:hypothetical protein